MGVSEEWRGTPNSFALLVLFDNIYEPGLHDPVQFLVVLITLYQDISKTIKCHVDDSLLARLYFAKCLFQPCLML